jgi:hypothetical protein
MLVKDNPLWYKELPDNGALEIEVIPTPNGPSLNIYSCANEDSILNILDVGTTIELAKFIVQHIRLGEL